jgi:predicted nucleotidyltransferase
MRVKVFGMCQNGALPARETALKRRISIFIASKYNCFSSFNNHHSPKNDYNGGGAVSLGISIPNEKIKEFCRRWKISELALFGSVLREDFSPDSDIDLLVRFFPEANYGLFDLVRMQDELKKIFGREVDLVEWTAIAQSRNYIRRKEILGTLEAIYAA